MFGLSAVAVAGLATAAVGAYSAYQSGQAASSAAQAQMNGQMNAIQTQQAEFNTINSQYSAQRNLGYGADTLLAQLFGIKNPTGLDSGSPYPGVYGTHGSDTGGGPGSPIIGMNGNQPVYGSAPGGPPGSPGSATPPPPDYSAFYNSPNYQFALDQGRQAVNRNASAGGSLYSSTTLNNVDKFSQGLASQQYQSYVSNLLSMAGLGANAVAGTSQYGQQTANNVSTAQIGIGNANASGILGQTSADNQMWKSIIGGITGLAGGGG